MLCNEEGSNTSARMYYVRATASRQAHCEACSSDTSESIGIGVAVVIGAIVALGLASASVHYVWRRISEETRGEITMECVAIMTRFTPQNKIKILLGFYVHRELRKPLDPVTRPPLASIRLPSPQLLPSAMPHPPALRGGGEAPAPFASPTDNRARSCCHRPYRSSRLGWSPSTESLRRSSRPPGSISSSS